MTVKRISKSGRVYYSHYKPHGYATNPKWREVDLYDLYFIQKKTLQEIANAHSVSRQYIQQRIKKLGIPKPERSVIEGTRKPSRTPQIEQCGSFDDFVGKYGDKPIARKVFLNSDICTRCGKETNRIERHHVAYPAKSKNDIELLCGSCHALQHKGKISFQDREIVLNKFLSGKTKRELAIEYKVSQDTITKLAEKYFMSKHYICLACGHEKISIPTKRKTYLKCFKCGSREWTYHDCGCFVRADGKCPVCLANN